MHYSFTNGRVLDIPDMCGYCEITTGGYHQLNCPAFPPIHKLYEGVKNIEKHIFGQHIREAIRIIKYDDKGNFIKEIQ